MTAPTTGGNGVIATTARPASRSPGNGVMVVTIMGRATNPPTASCSGFIAGVAGVRGEVVAAVPLLDHGDRAVVGIVDGVEPAAPLLVDGGDGGAQRVDELGGAPFGGVEDGGDDDGHGCSWSVEGVGGRFTMR